MSRTLECAVLSSLGRTRQTMAPYPIISNVVVLSVWALIALSSTEVMAGNFQLPKSASVEHFLPKPFKDGVRIDWLRNRVEIDAEVVLRRGPLELLVCSPGTREHESIFVSSAKPSAIYQAMGLIGLAPGHPVSYNPKTEQLIPPTGESLKLSVRWREGQKLLTVPVERLLQLQDEKKSPAEMDWMFTGSVRTTDGRFAADLEGTLVSVVDFASALIAVGALHSDSNELLWVQAFESRIPPVQTACTIIIESAERVTIGLVLLKGGELVHDGKAATPQGLAKLVKQQVQDHRKVVINLGIAEGVSEKIVEKTLASLVATGLDRSMVSLRRPSQ